MFLEIPPKAVILSPPVKKITTKAKSARGKISSRFSEFLKSLVKIEVGRSGSGSPL